VAGIQQARTAGISFIMQRAQSFNGLAGAHYHGSLAGLYNKNLTLIWRDLQSLVQDPDTAKGPRLALLEQAGFGQATGIHFHTDVGSGMVLFFAQGDFMSRHSAWNGQ
jgi:hypothetical protein